MKTFLFISFIFSTAVFAQPDFSMKEFDEMSTEQKIEIISAYKDFLRETSQKTELDKFSSNFKFSFISEAIASGEFDCFYAGWPSRSSRVGSKRLCTSPENGNPDYRSRASSCGSNSLLCQPAIFGNGLCVSVATPSLRNSAFAQCERKFSDSGKTLADVVSELNTPEKRADLEELVGVSERICREGFQKPLCNRLRNKILAVRNQVSSSPTLIAATRTAVEVTRTPVEPVIDCDPNTPGIQTVPPQITPVPQQRGAPVRVPTNEMRKISCSRPPLSGEGPSLESMTQTFAANNIHIVSGTVADTRWLQRFMDEFNKFPRPLREEMRSRGSRINLIYGTGVSEDPSWAREAARAIRPEDWVRTHDGRSWSQIPGSGGSLGPAPTPTRIVVNRLYEGHGAQSLFLHEYAHTLDSMYGDHAISRSPQWREALAGDSRARDFIQTVCGNYCNDSSHPEEAFAELFSYYHGCPETKNQMKSFMPSVSSFFDNLTNVRELLDGRRSPAGRR